MKKQNHLVSIIVPVYNVEEHLEKCILSLVSQTYENIEIIMIDDGSTDQSKVICDEYAHKDFRIKVFHQKNSGVSSARLKGFDNSKGEYVTFVDSDDYVSINYIEKLVHALESTNADMSGCQQWSVEKGSISRILFPCIGYFDQKKLNHFLKEDFLFNNRTKQPGIALQICEKMIKRQYVGEALIAANGLSIAEDQVALFSIITRINAMTIIPDCLYYYVKHSNQITKKYSLPLWESYLDSYYKIYTLDKRKIVLDQLLNRTFQNVILNTIYYKMPSSINGYKAFKNEIKKIDEHIIWKELFKRTHLKTDYRHLAIFFLFKFKMYRIFYLFFYRKISLSVN